MLKNLQDPPPIAVIPNFIRNPECLAGPAYFRNDHTKQWDIWFYISRETSGRRATVPILPTSSLSFMTEIFSS